MITWWSIVTGAARWHFFSQLIYPSSAGMVQAAALCVQRCPVFMVAKRLDSLHEGLLLSAHCALDCTPTLLKSCTDTVQSPQLKRHHVMQAA
jgi:hypothetical protein